MKKIIFTFLTAFSALGLSAQDAYDLSVSQQTYSDLSEPSLINNGVWDWDDFPQTSMPFSFSIDGQQITGFSFFDDNFVLMTENYDENEGTGYFDVFAATAFIQDRTYNSGVSGSPLGYKVEGEAGNRILKLEAKNVGLEEDPVADGNYYMNFQIWLYESDKSIEIHYGPTNVIGIEVLNDENVLFVGIGGDEDAYFIYGQSTDPTYSEFTQETFPEEGVTMDAYPSNGTVYRLAPDSTAGVGDLTRNVVTLYPNPASGVLNLSSDTFASTHYTVYDMMGKLVLEGDMSSAGQVNIERLTPGMYHIKVDGQNLKFIKG